MTDLHTYETKELPSAWLIIDIWIAVVVAADGVVVTSAGEASTAARRINCEPQQDGLIDDRVA